MKNITFSADERLIEAAREQAVADNTTLNEQFRQWLMQYARRRQAARAGATLLRLRKKYSSAGRKFTRDEMSGVDFIDSVLIYLFDRADPRRRGIAEGLIARAHDDGAVITCNTARG